MHNDKKKMFLSVIRLLAMSYLKPMKVNVTSVLIIFCHFCTIIFVSERYIHASWVPQHWIACG